MFFFARMCSKQSDTQLCAESAHAVIRFRSIVIGEYVVVSPVAKDCAAKRTNLRRRRHPTGCFAIERVKRLQKAVFVFGEDADPDFRRKILARGGSEDGMTMYRDFRGKDPDKRAMLRGRGLLNEPEPSGEDAAPAAETASAAREN